MSVMQLPRPSTWRTWPTSALPSTTGLHVFSLGTASDCGAAEHFWNAAFREVGGCRHEEGTFWKRRKVIVRLDAGQVEDGVGLFGRP